jgi:ArsR family transcriptional regulator, arsenate/arsenite/antimonite-responsive transcriptional repressor
MALAEYTIRWLSNYQIGRVMFNDAFKALADPSRRSILARLRQEGELTAGQLAEQFDMTKPTMSHHFAVLKDSGLVKSRRDGQQIIYSLNTTVVEDMVGIFLDLFQPDSKAKSNGVRKKGSSS